MSKSTSPFNPGCSGKPVMVWLNQDIAPAKFFEFNKCIIYYNWLEVLLSSVITFDTDILLIRIGLQATTITAKIKETENSAWFCKL
jgi:hypothetical protein